MKTISKQTLTTLKQFKVLAVIIGVIIPFFGALTAFAGGPERPTFTSANPATYVTFNSITDNPEHGDERNSVLIREAGVGTYVNDMKLQPGKEYEVYSYYHNNAATRLNTGEGTGIARNVRMSAQLPSAVKPGERGIVSTSITADNANPKKVWDEAYITSDSEVAIRYVPASARMHSGGAVNNAVLSDSLFSANGTFLGYSSLNGILPGCADYAGYVVYKIKVDQPGFSLTKEVANGGQNNWAKSVQAQPGSTVDYRISYKNDGTTDQNDVTIKDVLPAGQTYIAGSTKLTNNVNPNGLKVSDNVIGNGINIGTYGKGTSGTVTFSAKLASDQQITCEQISMRNTASAITGNGTKSDTATVTVPKPECAPVPTELPTTGPIEVIAGLIGIAAITFASVYYFKSRRELQDALQSAQTHTTTNTSSMTEKSEPTDTPHPTEKK
ncbi:DUF11 domain-containing protein [Candidatus Saccharibacteria bacterium]|nr:DUF11 domain-containing protein [Candidatus Saccharibacteria bacterium]